MGIAQDVLPILAQMDRSFYGKLERGERQPSIGVLLRIAKAFGTSAAELLWQVEDSLSTSWRPDLEVGAASLDVMTAAKARASASRAAASARRADASAPSLTQRRPLEGAANKSTTPRGKKSR